MLSDAIGDLLPSALAVALSPIPIVAVVLVLGGQRPRSAGLAFALGWVGGLLGVSLVVIGLLGTGNDPNGDTATGVDWLKVAIGVLFLAMAARQWAKRPRRGEEVEAPAWMSSVDSATPGRTLALGLALSAANPKNLALTLAAAASISAAGLDGADTAIAIAVFVALGSITVAGSVLLYLASPDRAAAPLSSVRQFMSANSAVIMMIVLLLIGAKLLGDGFGGL
ncbi:MAG: GAP family protein [Solirubrobacterales bacterium]